MRTSACQTDCQTGQKSLPYNDLRPPVAVPRGVNHLNKFNLLRCQTRENRPFWIQRLR